MRIAALAIGTPAAARAADAISEQEAHAIGVTAYTYLYSLVTMDLTRKQLTNVAKAEGIAAPMNEFANVPAFPTADMKVVVRPNFDTLYSSAWLDLTKEPMIVSVPDTHGRYYLLPMLDMWTDVFASPGWRTTGTQAGDYAVVPPGWSGSLPADVVRIDAPTPYVWIIGRTKTDGPDDYAAVHEIQAGYKIAPLSRWGKAAEPVAGTVDPARRHEDAAEDRGREDVRRRVLRLRRRDPQVAAAPHHRSADPGADAADRHRAGQELRPRQGRSGGQGRARDGTRGSARS